MNLLIIIPPDNGGEIGHCTAELSRPLLLFALAQGVNKFVQAIAQICQFTLFKACSSP
jgi:hypothetical protein